MTLRTTSYFRRLLLPFFNQFGGVGFFPACGLPGNDPCLATSMGALIFTDDIEQGDGRFRATVAQVPEPSLLLLVGGGAVVLVRRSRRSVRA